MTQTYTPKTAEIDVTLTCDGQPIQGFPFRLVVPIDVMTDVREDVTTVYEALGTMNALSRFMLLQTPVAGTLRVSGVNGEEIPLRAGALVAILNAQGAFPGLEFKTAFTTAIIRTLYGGT